MYAVYHGPEGPEAALRRRTRLLTPAILADGLKAAGAKVNAEPVFDTLTVSGIDAAKVHAAALAAKIQPAPRRRLHRRDLARRDDHRGRSGNTAVVCLVQLTSTLNSQPLNSQLPDYSDSQPLRRASRATSPHPVFNSFHTEHRDAALHQAARATRTFPLDRSMIPLGSCTMKLNATSEMFPVTWPEFGKLHPFAPADQTEGLRRSCSTQLREVAQRGHRLRRRVSLQPNAGSQGEYAGLLCIQRLARVAPRGAPQHLPHPDQRPRHQPRQRRRCATSRWSP